MVLAELHCHTIYSRGSKVFIEGLNRPREMLKAAKKLGVEIIAITDHDTMRGIKEARYWARKLGLLLIPGEEITTNCGHVLALGINEEVKRGIDFFEALDVIHEQGGVAIAAHPFDFRKEGVGKLAIYCDAIEAFNAMNLDRFANWRAFRFAKENGMPMVAGSDAHCVEMLGHGLNALPPCQTIDEVLNAIKHGEVRMKTKYVSTSVMKEWIVRRLRYSYYYVVNYISHNYSKPKRAVSLRLLKLVEKSPGKIDIVLKILAYFGLCCVGVYSALRNVLIASLLELLGR